MNVVRVGVQTNNDFVAAPDGFAPSISRNEIHATRTGIFHNLFYESASTYAITDNQFVAAADANQAGEWSGLWIESMQSAQTVVVSGNSIDGSALANSGRPRVGYLLNNVTSSAAGSTALDGGTVSHVDAGVQASDASNYTGPVDDILATNIAFDDVAIGAFYVEDTNEQDGSAKLTIGDGNTYTASVAHQLALAGAAPAVGFAGAQAGAANVLVRAAGNYFNGLPSAGGPACTGAPCTVANASINAGIADAAVGGTVDVEAGTFAENVIVSKSVMLQGPQAGIAGSDPSRDGSNEAAIDPANGIALLVIANNVTFDGFTIQDVTDTAIASGGQLRRPFGRGFNHQQPRAGRNHRFRPVHQRSAQHAGDQLDGIEQPVQRYSPIGQSASGRSGINLWAVTGGHDQQHVVTESAFGGIQINGGTNVMITRNTIGDTAHTASTSPNPPACRSAATP